MTRTKKQVIPALIVGLAVGITPTITLAQSSDHRRIEALEREVKDLKNDLEEIKTSLSQHESDKPTSGMGRHRRMGMDPERQGMGMGMMKKGMEHGRMPPEQDPGAGKAEQHENMGQESDMGDM